MGIVLLLIMWGILFEIFAFWAFLNTFIDKKDAFPEMVVFGFIGLLFLGVAIVFLTLGSSNVASPPP